MASRTLTLVMPVVGKKVGGLGKKVGAYQIAYDGSVGAYFSAYRFVGKEVGGLGKKVGVTSNLDCIQCIVMIVSTVYRSE